MPANKERLGCASVKVTSPDAQSNHGLFSSTCWTSIIMCRGLCCVSSLLQDRLLDYHPSETSVFVGAQERKDGFKSSPSRNILYLSHSCVISKTSHMPACKPWKKCNIILLYIHTHWKSPSTLLCFHFPACRIILLTSEGCRDEWPWSVLHAG